MDQAKFSLRGVTYERPPVVLLGDLTLVRPLAMAQIPVIVATADLGDVSVHSRHVLGYQLLAGFDDAAQPRTAATLVALGARLHAALGRRVPLFYGSDKHLELIYRHREALAEHYLLLLNDESLAWALHDKERFGAVAAAAGVLTPRTLAEGAADLEAALGELREPLLVKPKRKTAWRTIQAELFDGVAKARVFPTRAELLAHPGFARHRDALLVQEFIGGDAADLYSFHGFADERGRLLGSFCGRKVRTYPRFAGESSFVELSTEPQVALCGRDVAARLGLVGPFKIDLIRDPRGGRLYTLEINARFNLWHYLGAVHGANLPAVAYDYLVHGRAPEAPPRLVPRYRWVNFYRDYHAFREQHARGELGVTDWVASLLRGRTVYETFAWDDPAPFARWVGGFLRERAAR